MEIVETSDQSFADTSRKKIDTLISLGAGEIVNNALKKIIHYQLDKYRDHISQMNRELEKFEKSYNMSSKQFYHKFESGKLGDREDFFEWSGLYENILLYQKRIQELEFLNTE